MTLSITHLEDEGSTSPASRLTSSSTSPSANRRRCAYTSARASCHAPGEKTFFFSLIGRNLCPPASRAQARRGDDTRYDRGRPVRWQNPLLGRRFEDRPASRPPRDLHHAVMCQER